MLPIQKSKVHDCHTSGYIPSKSNDDYLLKINEKQCVNAAHDNSNGAFLHNFKMRFYNTLYVAESLVLIFHCCD